MKFIVDDDGNPVGPPELPVDAPPPLGPGRASTQFKPGQSGNPAGPRKRTETERARAMIQRFLLSPQGVRRLQKIAETAEKESDRIAAFRLLMEHGQAKPTQASEVAAAVGAGGAVSAGAIGALRALNVSSDGLVDAVYSPSEPIPDAAKPIVEFLRALTEYGEGIRLSSKSPRWMAEWEEGSRKIGARVELVSLAGDFERYEEQAQTLKKEAEARGVDLKGLDDEWFRKMCEERGIDPQDPPPPSGEVRLMPDHMINQCLKRLERSRQRSEDAPSAVDALEEIRERSRLPRRQVVVRADKIPLSDFTNGDRIQLEPD